jgi:hypothetical protein
MAPLIAEGEVSEAVLRLPDVRCLSAIALHR